jgi:hypothetical protein
MKNPQNPINRKRENDTQNTMKTYKNLYSTGNKVRKNGIQLTGLRIASRSRKKVTRSSGLVRISAC